MDVTVWPGFAQGSVRIPASKSLTHRAIICASLSKGRSTITNVDVNEDIQATVACMQALGAHIIVDEDRVTITGMNFQTVNDSVLDCGESGSTLRFIIPIASLFQQEIRFKGSERLLQRPQSVYKEIFEEQGLLFQHQPTEIIIRDSLKPGVFNVAGDVSSQFISGLLFTLPLMTKDSKIIVAEPFESRSYVALTIEMLQRFGISIKQTDNTLIIKGNQHYQACDYEVEGDYSQAAFFAVLGAINGHIDIHNLNIESTQGDKEIINIVEMFGADIEQFEEGYKVSQNHKQGLQVSVKDCPDLGPILAVLGMYSGDMIKVIEAERLRIKESDRITAITSQLNLLNVYTESGDDEMIVHQIINKPEAVVTVAGCNDHRIVMALAVAATKLDRPVTIQGADAINKSYPNFLYDLESLGIRVDYHE